MREERGPHGQAVKTSPFHGGNTSSILVGVTNGELAQLGEHLPYKQGVTGSSPVLPTNHNILWLNSLKTTRYCGFFFCWYKVGTFFVLFCKNYVPTFLFFVPTFILNYYSISVVDGSITMPLSFIQPSNRSIKSITLSA